MFERKQGVNLPVGVIYLYFKAWEKLVPFLSQVPFFYTCYGLNGVPQQNSHVEALTFNIMVFGDGDFERQLGLDEVMKVGPSG